MYKGPTLKAGIMFNGVDILDLNPDKVSKAIASLPKKQRELVKALIKDHANFNDVPEDYAKYAGRPSIKKIPYMCSENDGYPYLPGHVATCNGKIYHKGMCKYDKWNYTGGSPREMWPGMNFDDFDS